MKEKRKGQPHAQKQECGCPSPQASLRTHTLAFLAPLMLVGVFTCNNIQGQTPVIAIPQPATLKPDITIGSRPNRPTTANLPNYHSGKSIEQVNMEIINKDLNQTNASSDYLNSDYEAMTQSLYRKELLSFIQSNYTKAFNNLKSMLEGNSPLVLKRAVFEVEHAFNNTFSYESFDGNIQEVVKVINFLRGNSNANIPLNLSIAKAMSDTVSIPQPNLENHKVSYPFSYDFNDYYGDKDFNNMFVSKLLASHSGQCHSMPLLYLILAEEVGAQAYLSFSPNHSFIRFKDKRGQLYNYETTQGKLVSNEWVMGSGYISAEAVKSGVFLDTLNTQQVVANCLNDLAMGYIKIFGMNDTAFISSCTDLSLRYYPDKNASAYAIKSNMYLHQFLLEMQNQGIKDPKEFIASPKGQQLWDKHNKLYILLRGKGYRNIPRDKYDLWLKSANEVKSLNPETSLQKNIR